MTQKEYDMVVKTIRKYMIPLRDDQMPLRLYLSTYGYLRVRDELKQLVPKTKNAKETAYCEKCDKDVEFTTAEETITATMGGRAIEYKHIIANCKKCGERVYPVSIGLENETIKYKELEKEEEK